jgi:gliding motility-associated-like protein
MNTGKGDDSWYWTFGDGNNSSDSMPYHEYFVPGTYQVILIAYNKYGCPDTSQETVYVTEIMQVPNVFTPNGDGVNDLFHITAGGMASYIVYIYDRWGTLIFESPSPNIDWNGKNVSGIDVAVGTYFYIIKATDYSGKSYNQTGVVELIR